MSIFKEQEGARPRQMKGVELSRFAADLDSAWRSDYTPVGDKETLLRAAGLETSAAAAEVVARLNENNEVGLRERLGNIGILTGTLRENKGIPGGVIGVWRSDTPVILLTDELPARYSRAYEVAKALGVLTYGYEQPIKAKEFVDLVEPYLTEIEDGPHEELPCRRLGLAALFKR